MNTTRSSTPNSVSGSRLEKRLFSYGLAAGAMLAGGASASATVQFFNYSNNPQTTPVNGNLYFSLQLGIVPPSTTQGANSFRLRNGAVSGTNLSGEVRGLVPGASAVGLQPGYIGQFGVNAKIGSSRNFITNGALGFKASTFTAGPWYPGNLGFLGLKFNLGAGITRYGWAEVRLNPNYTITLYGVAYEDSGNVTTGIGNPIFTPSATFVPEPSELALLAAGALGLAVVRKRRQAKAA